MAAKRKKAHRFEYSLTVKGVRKLVRAVVRATKQGRRVQVGKRSQL